MSPDSAFDLIERPLLCRVEESVCSLMHYLEEWVNEDLRGSQVMEFVILFSGRSRNTNTKISFQNDCLSQ